MPTDDIDALVRAAYVERDQQGFDFSPDEFVGRLRSRRRRRHRRYAAYTSALAITVLAVGVTWLGQVGARWMHNTPTSSGGPHGQLSPIAVVLLSSDGRTITTSAPGSSCVKTHSFQARPTDGSIMLFLSGVPIDGNCNPVGVLIAVSTTLSKPLADRALIDGSTGHNVTVIRTSDLAEVSWLPPGVASDPVGIPATDPVGWERDYAADAGRVAVTQLVGDVRRSDLFAASTWGTGVDVLVNGHTAVLLHSSYGSHIVDEQIVWYQDGFTFSVRSMIDNLDTGKSALPASVLLQIANNIRPRSSH